MGLVVLALGAVLCGWRSIVSARFSPNAQTAHPAVAFIMVTAMGFGADMEGSWSTGAVSRWRPCRWIGTMATATE